MPDFAPFLAAVLSSIVVLLAKYTEAVVADSRGYGGCWCSAQWCVFGQNLSVLVSLSEVLSILKFQDLVVATKIQ